MHVVHIKTSKHVQIYTHKTFFKERKKCKDFVIYRIKRTTNKKSKPPPMVSL